MIASVIASIPSPSSGNLEIGPISIHAYGLMIALGVVAAVSITGRRLEASGAGTRDDASSMAVSAVIAGVIGARLYHVVTDYELFRDDPMRIFKIWEGGLGIPGGLLFGIAVGAWSTRRRGVRISAMLDAAAPAIPIAQAIGRLGNWFNQELFGKATTLPWALRIDDAHLPEGYAHGTTFHPTFLYEALWNVALAGVLVLIGRRGWLRPGRLMAVFVAGYAVGRFWVEGLRIDTAHHAGGLRLNQWMAIVIFAGAVGFLAVDSLRHRGEDVEQPLDPQDADAEGYVATDE